VQDAAVAQRLELGLSGVGFDVFVSGHPLGESLRTAPLDEPEILRSHALLPSVSHA
jgi:hypothetical protein